MPLYFAPGLCYRNNSFIFQIILVHIQRGYLQDEGRKELSDSCQVFPYCIYNTVSFFLREPRSKNLSSVILISTVLFLSSLHLFSYFLPSSLLPILTPFADSPSPSRSCFILTLSQLFSLCLSLFSILSITPFPSLSLSSVLIVYTLTFKKPDSLVQVTPYNLTSLPFYGEEEKCNLGNLHCVCVCICAV